LQEFGFCLIKFSFSKASLVFYLITGTAKNPIYLLFLVAENLFSNIGQIFEILQWKNKPSW